MSFYPATPVFQRPGQLFAPFLQGEGLPFAGVLTDEHVARILQEEGVPFDREQGRVFCTTVVLWLWMSQALDQDGSCRAAILRLVFLLALLERQGISSNTGNYCHARGQLPLAVPQRLAQDAATQLERQLPKAWRWSGRRTFLVDGFTISLADTRANQRRFPQPSCQKPGVGFPLLRVVVLISLATGAIVGLAYGPYAGKETGESALFRELLPLLQPGDVVIADRYYCSYWLLAFLQARQVEAVFRLHQLRQYDFRRGRRLGKDDHLVAWPKPQRPKWMDQATYAALPDTLTVRETRGRIDTPGSRVKEVVVATTLHQSAWRWGKLVPAVSAAAILSAFHQRWHVELDIRALKVHLGLEPLRCTTPARVVGELWVHCLAYNLTRKVLAQAAWVQDCTPRQLSFKAAVQALQAGWVQLTGATAEERLALAEVLLQSLRPHRVGNRPGRVEPRKLKRRGKPYRWLTRARAEERRQLFGRAAKRPVASRSTSPAKKVA